MDAVEGRIYDAAARYVKSDRGEIKVYKLNGLEEHLEAGALTNVGKSQHLLIFAVRQTTYGMTRCKLTNVP